MAHAYTILTLHAHSGIHAGSGQELGVVDLPIQRERTTGLPVLRGSSLKGALRQAVEDRTGLTAALAGLKEKERKDKLDAEPVLKDAQVLVHALFGSDAGGDQDATHAGALSVGDAKLLLFPVRSLSGVFARVTSPYALERVRRDLAALGAADPLPASPSPGSDEAVLTAGTALKVGEHAVLEEFAFRCGATVEAPPADDDLHLPGDLAERLAVLSDDSFAHFARFATEVVTRVHLDDETKTVKQGQLWTEELLPAESVLVAVITCTDARTPRTDGESLPDAHRAVDLLTTLREYVGGRLQVGGKETIGYGQCRAAFAKPAVLAANREN
ncbi:type III-B CRISPR module RAMP protein Cmr4 [Alienimonas californiensis]|uniref:RAMP superfamily protein n=1 Tax=Alienimonas californiensis TaxID=2527989 RepID=A0A517P6P3_9PLAN|nr:type III-B CRISPR module RAMP protein Cmr4 [Alienimonas californiensis]QDT15048.1 RAMP superfamily protein [Alienimonas californiensis]